MDLGLSSGSMLTHLHGWWIHEVKGEEVVDAHSLQGENGGGQVGPLDLGDGRGEYLVPVGTLRVQPVAFPRICPTGSNGSLLCLRLHNSERYKVETTLADITHHPL